MIRDVKQIQQSTIWQDTGRQISLSKMKDASIDLDSKHILVVVGDRNAGKSSFIKVVRNDFDPQTKPSCVMEYWGIKKGHGTSSYILEIYEIASQDLLSFVKRLTVSEGKKINSISFAVCVDLTRPKRVINSLLPILEDITKHIKAVLLNQNISPNYLKKCSEIQKTKQSLSKSEQKLAESIPFSMMIVGTKWDLFEKLDLESRKWISRSLRYISLVKGLHLLTTSNKNMQLNLQVRSFLDEHLTDINHPNISQGKVANKDFNKPLFIPSGFDSLKDISLPTSGNLSELQMLEKHLDSLPDYKSKGEESRVIKKIRDAKVNLRIDELITQRRKELAKISKRGQVEQI